MIPFVLFAPLFFALAAISIVNGRYARHIALLASLASLALIPLVSQGTFTYRWFSIGTSVFNITAAIAPINLILLAIVLVIAPLVFLYSSGFMTVISEQKRFYLEMLGFEIAMLGFAMSGNFILLLISWELLSLMSYLLIGFWNFREKANTAARKAVTTVLIGDIALLAAIAILQSQIGSLEFAAVLSSAKLSLYTTAAAFLVSVAILTKSAQFPFQEWLPDAMEGPTPVSAFLHSSTMVKAGVFALIVLLPFLTTTKMTFLILIASSITVVVSTLNAMKETHIKRLLAFSTVQELGLMMVAISSGALIAGIYFFFVQSFYKALLFFSSGVIMNSTGTEDLNQTSGLKKERLLYITTACGILSLAGFVPFSGFFANLGLGSSLISNLYLYLLITAVSMLTSFYIFRWFLLNTKKSKTVKVDLNYMGQPRSIVISMIILALATLISSAAFFYLPGLLGRRFSISTLDAGIEIVVVAVGAGISYWVYKKGMRLKSRILGVLAYNSAIMNIAYGYFVKFIYGTTEGFTLFDLYLSEAFDFAGKGIVRFGSRLRRLSGGNVNAYVLTVSVGMVAVLLFVYFTMGH